MTLDLAVGADRMINEIYIATQGVHRKGNFEMPGTSRPLI